MGSISLGGARHTFALHLIMSLCVVQVCGVELVQTDLVAGLMPRIAGTIDLLVSFVEVLPLIIINIIIK